MHIIRSMSMATTVVGPERVCEFHVNLLLRPNYIICLGIADTNALFENYRNAPGEV